MRFARAGIVVGVLVMAVRTVSSVQPVPVFSGTWQLDPDRSTRTGSGAGAGRGTGQGDGGGLSIGPTPERLVLQQTDATLSIEEHRGPAVARKVYRLDGTPAEHPIAAGRNAGGMSSSVTRWEGSRLVTTVTVPLPADSARTATYRETRALGADGALIVETIFTGRPARIATYTRSAPR